MTATERFIADLRALANQAAGEHASGARMALISSLDITTLRLLLDIIEKAGGLYRLDSRTMMARATWLEMQRTIDSLEAHLKETRP